MEGREGWVRPADHIGSVGSGGSRGGSEWDPSSVERIHGIPSISRIMHHAGHDMDVIQLWRPTSVDVQRHLTIVLLDALSACLLWPDVLQKNNNIPNPATSLLIPSPSPAALPCPQPNSPTRASPSGSLRVGGWCGCVWAGGRTIEGSPSSLSS